MSINYFSEKMKFLFCAINMVKQLRFLIGISCSYHIQSVMSMERHWYKRHCKFQCRKFIVARTSFLFLLDRFCNQSLYNHNTFKEQIFSTAVSNSCFLSLLESSRITRCLLLWNLHLDQMLQLPSMRWPNRRRRKLNYLPILGVN